VNTRVCYTYSTAYRALFSPQSFTYKSQLTAQDDIIIYQNIILDWGSIVSSLIGIHFVTACIEDASVCHIN
jgi:hypothetical protein